MTVRVLAFARIREVLGAGERTMTLTSGARIRDVWAALLKEHPGLAQFTGSTRIARNAVVAREDDAIAEGDELALLPPVGGG